MTFTCIPSHLLVHQLLPSTCVPLRKSRSLGVGGQTSKDRGAGTGSGGGRDRKTMRQSRQGGRVAGEKAPAPVGFSWAWIAELCTHSGLSLSSAPPPCLLRAASLFLSAGIPCLSGYFHSCPLCMCMHLCVNAFFLVSVCLCVPLSSLLRLAALPIIRSNVSSEAQQWPKCCMCLSLKVLIRRWTGSPWGNTMMTRCPRWWHPRRNGKSPVPSTPRLCRAVGTKARLDAATFTLYFFPHFRRISVMRPGGDLVHEAESQPIIRGSRWWVPAHFLPNFFVRQACVRFSRAQR